MGNKQTRDEFCPCKKKGDLLWNADLNYIKENAIDDCLLMIITKGQGPLEKNYGHKKSGETILKIKR